MSRLEALADAATAFFDDLAGIDLSLLAIALCFHVTNTALRSVAWRAILAAAFPDAAITFRSAYGAMLAANGLNGLLPGRSGEAVRIAAIHHRHKDTTVAGSVATLAPESLVDIVVIASLAIWAVATHRIPGFSAAQPIGFAIAGVVAVPCLVVGAVARERLSRLRRRIAAGFAIVHMPRAYLVQVAIPQLAGWLCRCAAAYFVMLSFGLEPGLAQVLLVQVAATLSTLIPLTPGGVGAQQSLLVVFLSGLASTGALLSYATGAQAILTVFNALLGGGALLFLFGTLRPGAILRAATARV